MDTEEELKLLQDVWTNVKTKISDRANAIIDARTEGHDSPHMTLPSNEISKGAEMMIDPPATVATGPNLSYWSSTKAFQLFGVVMEEDDEESGVNTDIIGIIKNRIKRLEDVAKTPSGWRNIVSGKKDYLDDCSDSNIYWIKVEARYVARALQIALEEMPGMTWEYVVPWQSH